MASGGISKERLDCACRQRVRRCNWRFSGPSLIAGNRNRNRPVFTRLYPTRTTTRTCRSGKRNLPHPCERWPNLHLHLHLPILPSPRIIVSSPRPILMHRCFTPPTRARSSSAPASGNAPTPPPLRSPLSTPHYGLASSPSCWISQSAYAAFIGPPPSLPLWIAQRSTDSLCVSPR
jgi:hypothetical protein